MACIITYYTESGDDGFVGVFNTKMTDAQWFQWVDENMPDEIVWEEDGTAFCCAYQSTYDWNGYIDDLPKDHPKAELIDRV